MVEIRDLLRELSSLDGVPPARFDPLSCPDDPGALFAEWFAAAVEGGVVEPHAMTLSTIGSDGVPDARVLIVKDVTPDCWWFASSSESVKGLKLAQKPVAALTFYWPAQARSVRIRGVVESAPASRSAADFAARGVGARAVALASRESQPVASRVEVDRAVGESRSRLRADPQLTSLTWTLWGVHADAVEFWQADPNRQHLRVRYTRDGSTWSSTMLWP